MSEQHTITAGHILHVLVSSRGYAEIDQRHISAALKAALANHQGQGVRYDLDSAVLASQDAGYTLSADEIEALAGMDATASEVQ
jgi:pyruvoyl-dependent arginine decarboxylase (PvlArgDC)